MAQNDMVPALRADSLRSTDLPVGPIKFWRYPDVLATKDAALRLHTTEAAFVAAARRAGIAPTWTRNFVDNWDASARELIRKALLVAPGDDC